jgi:hypothetical protein
VALRDLWGWSQSLLSALIIGEFSSLGRRRDGDLHHHPKRSLHDACILALGLEKATRASEQIYRCGHEEQ